MKFLVHTLQSTIKGPTLGITVGVHGDEEINVGIVDILKELKIINGKALLIVANMRAIEMNQRFVELDLNRVFPGDADGAYEESLASELTKTISQCDFLIDFHAFEKKSPPFAILPTRTMSIDLLAEWSNIEHIVYMPGQGKSLVEQSTAGIGIELGTKNDPKNVRRGVNICKRVMTKLGMLADDLNDDMPNSRKYYLCNDKLFKPKGFVNNHIIKNFQLVKKGQVVGTVGVKEIVAKEDFYPILLDSPSLGSDYLCRIGKLIPC